MRVPANPWMIFFGHLRVTRLPALRASQGHRIPVSRRHVVSVARIGDKARHAPQPDVERRFDAAAAHADQSPRRAATRRGTSSSIWGWSYAGALALEAT